MKNISITTLPLIMVDKVKKDQTPSYALPLATLLSRTSKKLNTRKQRQSSC